MSRPDVSDAKRARAKATVARLTDEQVIALNGNWRPLKPPPLPEFVRHCLIVAKESGSLIPFDLWPAQAEALEVIEKTDKLIIPKGRQVGITWLELAAMLWAGTFSGNCLFPIVRQSDDYAQEAIGRLLILAGYDPTSEPANLALLPESPMPKRWRATIAGKNLRVLRLANGSTFRALAASPGVGRGMAAYWGLADEYAFWPWPADQLSAMDSGCTRLHIVSTGNGADDAFAALYENAAQGRGTYRTLFISSEADPRRDAEWYRRNVTEAADPEMARREHARSPQDAFAGPEGIFFKRFDSDRHVQDVEIINNWQSFRGIDFGFRHAACLWAQRSPSGQLFIVDELLPEHLTTPEFVAAIKAREAGYGLVMPVRASYCDPAGQSANVQTAASEFEVFRAAGLAPQSKHSGVRDGCVRIMDQLADEKQPLIIASRCGGLIRALSAVKPHRSHPETYDNDHVLFSHPLDALRYLLVNIETLVIRTVPLARRKPNALGLLNKRF
jgi:hypothetical protein